MKPKDWWLIQIKTKRTKQQTAMSSWNETLEIVRFTNYWNYTSPTLEDTEHCASKLATICPRLLPLKWNVRYLRDVDV